MAERGLHIAEDLALPLDLVVQKTAILARSGAGKTTAATVVVEELLDARQQVVVLDPPGAWWGLRSSADGKRPGYPVVVLGGIHGDLPLEPAAGAVVANLVIDQSLSAVLDLSEFTDGELARFVSTFAQRLYARKNEHRDPMLLVLEEADELAPQNIAARERGEGGQAVMLHHVERIAKRGRMRGIGFLAITQRSAALNKHVLSQVEVLIAMQTTAPQDIAAIREWVRDKGDPQGERELLEAIARLPIGTGYIWSPSWLRMFRRVSFRTRGTFDSSATPEPGKRQTAPKTLADVDLEQLRQQLAAIIEKAQADDPRELRRRIAELERQLRERPTAEPRVEIRTERVEVPVLSDAQIEALQELARRLEEDNSAARALLSEVRDAVAMAGAAPAPVALPHERQPRQPVARIDPVPRAHRRPPPHSPAPRPEQPSVDGISAPQQRILDALASFAAAGLADVARSNVAVFAGQSSASSGFANNLGALRSRGLIDYPSGGRVVLTDAGHALAAPTEPIRSLEELHEAWQRKLSAPQWRILQALIAVYPKAVSRGWLADESGQSASSSGYANNLGALRSLGLLDYPASGMVAATELLFPQLPKGRTR